VFGESGLNLGSMSSKVNKPAMSCSASQRHLPASAVHLQGHVIAHMNSVPALDLDGVKRILDQQVLEVSAVVQTIRATYYRKTSQNDFPLGQDDLGLHPKRRYLNGLHRCLLRSAQRETFASRKHRSPEDLLQVENGWDPRTEQNLGGDGIHQVLWQTGYITNPPLKLNVGMYRQYNCMRTYEWWDGLSWSEDLSRVIWNLGFVDDPRKGAVKLMVDYK
jgi:hypothetical protein